METDIILTQKLPNSEFHFKPDRITNMDLEYVTMDGREAMSNMNLSIRIPIDQFISWCMDYSKEMNKFLVEYHTQNARKDKLENKVKQDVE
jgi:hypothetical protein